MHRDQTQLRYCSSLNLILCNGKDMSQNALRNSLENRDIHVRALMRAEAHGKDSLLP